MILEKPGQVGLNQEGALDRRTVKLSTHCLKSNLRFF